MRDAVRILVSSLLAAAVLLGPAPVTAGGNAPPTVLGSGRLSAAQSAADLFHEARHLEEVVGDLQAAIQLYQRIVEEFPSQRSLAARALVQMGLCFEKMGKMEAEGAYERVLNDYADQTEIVTLARTRLAALSRPTEPEEGSAIVVRRVQFDDGGGGPTTDGRHLCYIDWDSGNVAVHDLVTGESRRLTNDGSMTPPQRYPINAKISPDGQLVAYSWAMWTEESGIELRLVGLDGSGQRVLHRGRDIEIYPRSWSSDGRHIAAAKYGGGEAMEIVWVSIDDGSARTLEVFPQGFGGLTLSHSPDDRYIATVFPVERDSGNFDIALVATDGSGGLPLIEHPANDRLLGWLPGTDEVLFLSDRSGTWDMWAIRVADGKAQAAARPVRRAMGQVNAMGFTRAGSLFYSVFTRRFTTSIAEFESATGQLQLSTARSLLGSYFLPDWSPDGRFLALVSEERGPAGAGYPVRYTLHVRDLERDEARVVAPNLNVYRPRWSPDGRSVLVVGKDRTIKRDGYSGALYSIDVESGEAEAVVELPPDGDWTDDAAGVWSGNGESIFYVHKGRLLLRGLASQRETELYRDPDLATYLLALSPNGRQLAFGVVDHADPQSRPRRMLDEGGKLMMLPSSGGQVRELATIEQPGSISRIVWSPDGEHVFFMQDRKGHSTLWRVSVEGDGPEKVWEADAWIIGEFALTPGGDRIVYTTYEQDTEIWVMENIVAALREPS